MESGKLGGIYYKIYTAMITIQSHIDTVICIYWTSHKIFYSIVNFGKIGIVDVELFGI